jgi:hypothetical protein
LSKQIWERHNYTNHDIGQIINGEIIEYDIKAAGLNLAKEFGYIDKKILDKLESMSKKDRNIQMGLLKKKDEQLSKKENEAFIEARKLFIVTNKLDVEDIVAIKKDAIFVSRRCNNRKFGNIEFIPKNKYTSYMELNKLEFYYNSNQLDVKGIGDSVYDQHRDYMIDFFKTYFSLMEIDNKAKLINYITNFVYRYKSRLLDLRYYRELNVQSTYRLNIIVEKKVYGLDNIDDSSFETIDISYNYFKYLVPLCTSLI